MLTRNVGGVKSSMKIDMITVDVRVSDRRWVAALGCDAKGFVGRVIQAAGARQGVRGDVAVLLTRDSEMRTLNKAWRAKDKPTNVLSFPAPAGFGSLGDVALGYDVIVEEAQAQGKSIANHTAHLLTHGFLHLLGFDHLTESEASAMEALERCILADLGIADPYEDSETEGAALTR